jgi:hypothetical protein
MRTRLTILILAAFLSGSFQTAPSGVAAILRLVAKATGDRLSPPNPKATGSRLSPPNPAPAPLAAPRCATADCQT